MLTLLKSERFQKEYKEFYKQISLIENESFKKELEGLLNKLVNEVRSIDKQATELVVGQTPVPRSNDSRHTIFELRNTLSRKLADYAESIKN
jgi:hypothetical protein